MWDTAWTPLVNKNAGSLCDAPGVGEARTLGITRRLRSLRNAQDPFSMSNVESLVDAPETKALLSRKMLIFRIFVINDNVAYQASGVFHKSLKQESEGEGPDNRRA